MQFFGFKENLLFSALDANKKELYTCPECGGFLKLRSGPLKSPHFYHLERPKTCHQHGKTQEHLETQLFLHHHLPKGEAKMEHAFPEIGRIADVAWLSSKIIFEVQCSPIRLEEVEQRNADYASLGFQVIWILHDKRFNRRRLSAAEKFLREGLSFFSNVSAKGNGFIYDQREVLEGFRRKRKDAFLPIAPHHPISFKKVISLPEILAKRMGSTSLYFQGDITDRFLAFGEDPVLETTTKAQWPFSRVLYRLYRRLFLGTLRLFTHDDLSNPLSK